MIKLLPLILEIDYSKKETIKKTFHTYSCYYIIKFVKKVNRTEAVERIRGIKTVTIVDLRGDSKLDKINKRIVDYEYSSVEVKFVTNANPVKQVEYIKKAMVKSDVKSGIYNIVGIIGATPRYDTLKKID